MALQSKTITGSTSNSAWTYKLVVTENSTDINSNTSSVSVTAYLGRASSRSYIGGTWSGSITVNGSTQNMSGTIQYPTYIDGGAWISLATKTFSVGHNADGTKTTSISSSWSPEAGVTPSSASASGNMTLTTIPRASSVSGGSGNIGENTTISISRYSSSFTHTLTYSFGSLSGTIVTKTSSTSISWTIPTSFYSQIPNSNNGTGTITCTTYNGNTNVGTKSCQFTARVINSNPIFSDYEYEDTNTDTINLTGNNQSIIKNYSTLKVLITNQNKATSQNSSSMTNYVLGDRTISYSSTDDVYFSIPQYNSGANLNVKAVDSRSNATTVSKTITNYIEYVDLVKDSISVSRSNNGVGEIVTLNFNGTWWNDSFGSVNNDLSINYYFKKTSDSSYVTGSTTIVPIINSNNFSFSGIIRGDSSNHGFEIEESYDIQVVVSDRLSSVLFNITLGSGSPAIAIYKNKVSLGEKYDTSLGGTQLWGDIFINGSKYNQYKYSSFSDVSCTRNSSNNLTSLTLTTGIWVVVGQFGYTGSNLRYYFNIGSYGYTSAYDSHGNVAGNVSAIINVTSESITVPLTLWPTDKNVTVSGNLKAIKY